MKKVCFFVTSLNSGGIENYLLRFLTHFDNKIEATVFCKGGDFGELENKYRELNNIKLVRSKIGYFDFRSYCTLFQLIKKEKFNAVCDFTGNFAGLVLMVGKLVGTNKRISFYRGSSNHFNETKFKLLYNSMMQKFVEKYATKILSNSKAALDFFYADRDNTDRRFDVIYNGIDAKKFKANSTKFNKVDFGIPSGGFVVGHTGRYNSAKNHETIIKVAEVLCAKHDDIYFILCGKDTDVYLNDVISNHDVLKNKVKVLGYRDDVQDILPVFDIYFFPSITEGQPNSLIEAMIMGIPIVASDIDPILETTPDSLHQELINPLDVDGFCNRIEEYYVNRQKRVENNFSEWAAKQFNPEVLFNKFYNEL